MLAMVYTMSRKLMRSCGLEGENSRIDLPLAQSFMDLVRPDEPNFRRWSCSSEATEQGHEGNVMLWNRR